MRYDPITSQPLDAEIVDADEDLGELCARMRSADRTSCAILHAEEDTYPSIGFGRPIHSPRAMQ